MYSAAKYAISIWFLLGTAIFFVPACLFVSNSNKAATVMLDDQTLAVVVVGGGVAGLTAAEYLTQANIPTLVVQGPKPGGALAQSHSVRNWPGVPEAPGEQIVGSLQAHAQKGGAKVLEGWQVVNIDLQSRPFTLRLESLSKPDLQKTVKTFTCILAMGAEPNYLGIPGERSADGYWGKGVSNCAVCEGSLYKDKLVAVVGGGDGAIAEADYLAPIARSVTVLVRGGALRAKDQRAVQRLKALPNVLFKFNTSVQQCQGDGQRLTHVVVRDCAAECITYTMPLDGLFLAIGSRPNTAMVSKALACDEQGFVQLTDHQATSVSGVYAAGDLCKHLFTQAINAASDGCTAALQVQQELAQASLDLGRAALTLDTFWEHLNPLATPSMAPLPQTEPETKPEEKSASAPLLVDITSQETLQRLVSDNQLCILKCYSRLCIPCKQLEPIIHDLAKKQQGVITVAQINMGDKRFDAAQAIKTVLNTEVQSVPTVIGVRQGNTVFVLQDPIDANRLEEAVQKSLLLNP